MSKETIINLFGGVKGEPFGPIDRMGRDIFFLHHILWLNGANSSINGAFYGEIRQIYGNLGHIMVDS